MLPHKSCVNLLIACSFIAEKNYSEAKIWLYFTQYSNKKYSDQKSIVDEELSKIVPKILKRKNWDLVKYEILYFGKKNRK
jgi:hypothetical protein